jgi:hypothetical protein
MVPTVRPELRAQKVQGAAMGAMQRAASLSAYMVPTLGTKVVLDNPERMESLALLEETVVCLLSTPRTSLRLSGFSENQPSAAELVAQAAQVEAEEPAVMVEAGDHPLGFVLVAVQMAMPVTPE